jgi:hypothetical protein
MKANEERKEELAALSRLIEASGADRTRWPAPDRLRFAGLLKSDPEARRMLAEAAALDRLLDKAPRVPESRHAELADRIAAMARSMPRQAVTGRTAGGAAEAGPEQSAGHVAHRRAPGVTDLAAVRSGRARASGQSPWAGRSGWQAAGLLAASLVLGIALGGAGLLAPAMGHLPGVSSGEGGELAFGLDRAAAVEEDTL